MHRRRQFPKLNVDLYTDAVLGDGISKVPSHLLPIFYFVESNVGTHLCFGVLYQHPHHGYLQCSWRISSIIFARILFLITQHR